MFKKLYIYFTNLTSILLFLLSLLITNFDDNIRFMFCVTSNIFCFISLREKKCKGMLLRFLNTVLFYLRLLSLCLFYVVNAFRDLDEELRLIYSLSTLVLYFFLYFIYIIINYLNRSTLSIFKNYLYLIVSKKILPTFILFTFIIALSFYYVNSRPMKLEGVFVSESGLDFFSIEKSNDKKYTYYTYNHYSNIGYNEYTGTYTYHTKNKYMFNTNNSNHQNFEVYTTNKGIYVSSEGEKPKLYIKIINTPIMLSSTSKLIDFTKPSFDVKNIPILENLTPVFSNDTNYEYKVDITDKKIAYKIPIGFPSNFIVSKRNMDYYDGYSWQDTIFPYAKIPINIKDTSLNIKATTGKISFQNKGIYFDFESHNYNLYVFKDFEINTYCYSRRILNSNDSWETLKIYTETNELKTYLVFSLDNVQFNP